MLSMQYQKTPIQVSDYHIDMTGTRLCYYMTLTMFLGVLQSFGYGSNILQIHIAKRFLVLSMEEGD